jgi:mRNA-degrading endonuclease RelE of RelBE toxin-antitoxin system
MSKRWTIRVRPNVMRASYRLPRGEVVPLSEAIASLQLNPRPASSTPVTEFENGYELKVGPYRIVYEIIAEQQAVKVLEIE